MNPIQFRFDFRGQAVILPINPAEISLQQGSPAIIHDIISMGQVSSPGKPELTRLSVYSPFLREYIDRHISSHSSLVVNRGWTVPQYVTWFRWWQRQEEPALLTVSSGTTARNYVINPIMHVLCEYREPSTRFGHEGSVFHQLNLVEFKHHRIRIARGMPATATTQTIAVPPPQEPRFDNRQSIDIWDALK